MLERLDKPVTEHCYEMVVVIAEDEVSASRIHPEKGRHWDESGKRTYYANKAGERTYVGPGNWVTSIYNIAVIYLGEAAYADAGAICGGRNLIVCGLNTPFIWNSK